MPFGFHLAMDTLPSGVPQEDGSRPALAVSGFRLRARLGFSIPAFSPRPARHYPRFRIWRPSSERQRDFNPPEQRAAQRTLCLLPTSPRYSAPVAQRPAAILRSTGEISRGKTRYLPCIDAGFTKCTPTADGGLRGHVPARPGCITPHIRFLFIVPQFRIELPSDPASRRRPCPSPCLRLCENLAIGLAPMK